MQAKIKEKLWWQCSAENGYPKPPKDTLVTAALCERGSTIVSSFTFSQRNWMFFREHGHVHCCDLRTLVTGSSGHGMRQTQLFSGSWLGAIISTGRKLWPYIRGIHQESCTAQTEQPGSSSWISAHQMESYSILALRLMSCLAPGCWAAAFSWYSQIFVIQVI